MPNTYLKSKIEERASQSEVLRSLQTRATDEKRDLTDAERKTFDEIVDRLKALDEEIARISAFDEGAAKFAALVGAQAAAEEKAEKAHDDAAADDDDDKVPDKELATRAAFGTRFVESTAFKSYRGAGTSERCTLPGPASPEFRAAITTATIGLTAYTGPVPQLWGGAGGPMFANTILDLIGRVATNQSAVMYLKWEPNPPADAAEVAEGDLKTEAPMDVTEATIALKTVAHWKAITRQALEDIPQVQTIVQNRLLAGVRSKLEADAVAALVAAGVPSVEGADLLSAIRVGIATVEDAGYTANAVAVNPEDAATLDLNAMGVTYNGPVRNGTAWGLRIVAARSIAPGSAYVGDFTQGLTWFDRGTTDVYMSDSHADFFLRNQLVILAEARAAFAATEAGAIVEAAATAPAGMAASAPSSPTSTSGSGA
jgi:HK97 family phage major capsid protein